MTPEIEAYQVKLARADFNAACECEKRDDCWGAMFHAEMAIRRLWQANTLDHLIPPMMHVWERALARSREKTPHTFGPKTQTAHI